ncbi:MAG: hypothetical protein O7E52_20205 [Candidatus Poribacteria bacterium]|nr:hypothetical protein [Candidatus Poribacteria bacterium]
MKDQRTTTRITKRAVLIGALLIIANSYWIAYVEMIWHTAHLTTVSLSVNVMFAVVMLTWLNMMVLRVYPQAALSQQDLLIIYAMLAVGSAFSGHDCIPRLMGLMPYAFRFATPENDWAALLFHHLPEWLVISNPKAVTDFFEGGVDFFTDDYLRFWIKPILSWSVVIFSLMLIFLCLTSILRRQWVAREKLAYPIIQIPLEITTQAGSIFTTRLLWVGFGIAAGIDLLNGLEFFFPILPSIPINDRVRNTISFSQKPWNALGNTSFYLHPYLIGLSFVLPLDLSFSCTFFYIVRKAQLVAGSMAGVAALPGYPFFGEQGSGALFALLAVVCWTGRKHFAHVISSVVRPDREADADEPISYRTAVIILCICLLVLMLFCLKGGMSVWGFAVFIGIYLAIIIGLARMRAELGPPIHSIGYVTPQYLMISMFGTRRLGAGNLTVLSLMNWLSGAGFRTHPLPDQLESFKLAERTGIRNRTMFIALIIASIVGIESSLILYPYTIYKTGVAAGSEQIHSGGRGAYNFLSTWLVNPRPTDWLAMSILGLTFFLNLGIMFLRARFVWCPLHPAGYVIGVAPGTTDMIWFPVAVAMVVKWLLLKHGGIRAYRKALPFFIGLVLGEAVVGCFWPMLSLILTSSVYSWW